MTKAERIERGRRAKWAMDEFFTPALASIESDYAEKMIAAAASADPRAPDVIARLANGIKVARQVRAQVEAIIADGDVAQNERDAKDRMADMSGAKLRLLNIGAV